MQHFCGCRPADVGSLIVPGIWGWSKTNRVVAFGLQMNDRTGRYYRTDAAKHLDISLDPLDGNADFNQRQILATRHRIVAFLNTFDDNGEPAWIAGAAIGRIGIWSADPSAPVLGGVADRSLIFAPAIIAKRCGGSWKWLLPCWRIGRVSWRCCQRQKDQGSQKRFHLISSSE